MSSKTEIISEVPLSALPPVISNNPRIRIEPEQVDVSTLIFPRPLHELKHKQRSVIQQVSYSVPKLLAACPRYPLSIIWSPDQLYFEIDEDPIIRKLWIWNGSNRTIYIHCCGLWNDKARLGASWCCYPRTRFHLAPGLKSTLFIKATPKATSSVPSAYEYVGLQLAASHMRDTVTGYFIVPIVVNFTKFKEPCFGEGE